MEENHVDPYAPPEAATSNTSNTTYLKEDGYAFQNELVANQYFKSPLICAKLGIPIPPESNPEPKEITVTRIAKSSGLITFLVFLITIITSVIYILASEIGAIFVMITAYIALSIVYRIFLSRPYNIPFYFSEQYTRIRKNRIFIFSIIFFILALLLVSGIASDHPELTVSCLFGNIITFILFRLKTGYFTVIQTKGDYHYIQGVHKNLLNALPQLPLSS
jgi:hypothetical protein